MSVKEKLIGIMGTAHPRLVSRLVTCGVGLAIVAVVAIGVVAVGGGTGTLQQAYAQEACPEGYTFDRGLCTAAPIPGGGGGCPGDFPKQSVGGLEFCGRLVDRFPAPVAVICSSIVVEEPNIVVFVPDDPANPLGRGECQIYQTADPLPSSEPSCPDTENFRDPEIVNGQCQVRPGEGEPEPGDDEIEEEVEEGDE